MGDEGSQDARESPVAAMARTANEIPARRSPRRKDARRNSRWCHFQESGLFCLLGAFDTNHAKSVILMSTTSSSNRVQHTSGRL